MINYKNHTCAIALAILAALWMPSKAPAEVLPSDVSVVEKTTTVKEKKDTGGAVIDNAEPLEGRKISMSEALLFDAVVPGGGHFYTGNNTAGYVFIGLKLFGAYLIYYTYRDWKYRESLYRSARSANEHFDPDHELEFKDPGGGYSTVEDYRRQYDRAAQRITFSVIANVAVYAVSLIMTYQAVKKINTVALPTFEIHYSRATFDSYDEMMIEAYMTKRF